MSKNAIRIPPFYYIHILDKNSNITRLELGPQTFIVQDHEMVSTGDKPVKMIVLQPNTYCEITNPVIRNVSGNGFDFIRKSVFGVDQYNKIKGANNNAVVTSIS